MTSAVDRLTELFKTKPVAQLVPITQLSNLPDSAFFELFGRLLAAAVSIHPEHVGEKVEELIDHFTLEIERGLNENYPITAITRYLVHLGPRMDEDQLDLLRTLYDSGYVRYLDTFLQIANWVSSSGSGVMVGLQTLNTIRDGKKVLSTDEAQLILSTGRSYNHYQFINLFSELFLDLLPSSTTPSYVSDLGLGDVDLDSHVEQLLNDTSISETVEAAAELISDNDSVDNLSPEKIEELSKLARLQDDQTLMQVLGPVNYNDNSPSEECQKYGGCRYLTCRCHDTELYDDQGVPDWFLGYCVECGILIPSRQSAIRQTMAHGGFRGCYCSVQCLAINLYNMEHQDSFIHEDLMPSTVEETKIQLHDSVAQLLPEQLSTIERYYISKLPLTDQLLTATTLQQLYKYGLQSGRTDGAVNELRIETSDEYYQLPSYYQELFA